MLNCQEVGPRNSAARGRRDLLRLGPLFCPPSLRPPLLALLLRALRWLVIATRLPAVRDPGSGGGQEPGSGWLIAGLWLALAALAPAASGAQDRVTTPRVEATLVAEHGAVVRGASNWVGLHLRLLPHWHVYWRNPGDSGYPPSLDWQLPAGVQAGGIVWPAPRRIAVGPLANFGYEDEVLLAVPIDVPADYAAPRLPLRLAARWLVCRDDCIPESATFTLDLPVVASVERAAGQAGQAALFAAARAAWPAPSPPPGWSVSARREDGQVSVRIVAAQSAPLLASLSFFPDAEGLLQAAAGQAFARIPEGYRLTLRPAEVPIGEWTSLTGVLVAGSAAGAAAPPLAFAVDVPIEGVGAAPLPPSAALASGATGSAATATVAAGSPLPFIAAVALAFAGGLLLNLMPCVFPVLSIKLLALLRQAGDDAAGRRQRRRHALLYTAGVVVTFLSLAALLLAVKAGGAYLGWGFQLQSPAFVGTMALLFFALGLSLSGALPMATLAQDVPGAWRQRHPAVDAFAGGALAVLVASPCTAPFMGAALGAAFTMPAVLTLLVFLALALGMAAPYGLLAMMPRGLHRLPRAGAWMLRIEELLALPLYATVVWLAWVLVEQLGAAAIPHLGGGLLLLALLAWALRLERRRWRVAVAAAALLGALATVLTMPSAQPSAGSAAGAAAANRQPADHWEPWSVPALAAARTAHAGVFVDFTAAWCVTCQLNKRLVLSREAVLADFARADVHLLRADWTRHDPEITRALTTLGRSGVPVYALYPPRGEPILLPELLTHDALAAALARLPATPGDRRPVSSPANERN